MPSYRKHNVWGPPDRQSFAPIQIAHDIASLKISSKMLFAKIYRNLKLNARPL